MKQYTTVIIYRETDGGGCHVAYHPELPTVLSRGDTPAQARHNLIEAAELSVAHLIENNLPIPEPMPWTALNNITIDCGGNNA